MKLTPKQLTANENAIFGSLSRRTSFRSRLYRDGVPSPEVYLEQRPRVLFVFREPNLGGRPRALDMRDQVRDERFRPLGRDGAREDMRASCWWNAKAGMFAHAVSAALEGEKWTEAFNEFAEGDWNHEVVNRYAYIQIKKVGGGGTANPREICEHAEKYAATLKSQIDLYRPDLILGCGTPPASPAELLVAHVLATRPEPTKAKTGATWWKFPQGAYPRALVQLWHPSRRGSRAELYEDVHQSVRDVDRKVGLR